MPFCVTGRCGRARHGLPGAFAEMYPDAVSLYVDAVSACWRPSRTGTGSQPTVTPCPGCSQGVSAPIARGSIDRVDSSFEPVSRAVSAGSEAAVWALRVVVL